MAEHASLVELVGTVADGLAAMRQLRAVLWQAGGPELGELFGVLNGVKAHVEATQVVVLAEAMHRGETTNPATTTGTTATTGGGHHGWVLRPAPAMPPAAPPGWSGWPARSGPAGCPGSLTR